VWPLLTERYVRVTHTATWTDRSEFQRELVRDLRRVEVVPQGLSETNRLVNQRGG
jgi:hypothetical protein